MNINDQHISLHWPVKLQIRQTEF